MIFVTRYNKWKIIKRGEYFYVVFKPHGFWNGFKKWILYRNYLICATYQEARIKLQQEMNFELY